MRIAVQALIDAGNQPTSSRSVRIAAYKRGLRFWKLAESLAKHGALSRRELIGAVFAPSTGASASEVEQYISAGLLTYCNAPPWSEEASEYSSSSSSSAGRAAASQLPTAAATVGVDSAEVSIDSNQIWVAPAAPRLRCAFASMVNADPSCQAYKVAAETELAKHEQAMRMEQLAARRVEIAAETTAVARVLEGCPALVEESSNGPSPSPSPEMAIGWLRELAAEGRAGAAELRRVRAEYDAMKWKGRWATDTS